MRKGPRIRQRPALLLAIASLLLPATLAGQRTLVLERFDAELTVRANGDLEVIETLRPRFTGAWNGVFRNLSLAHQTAERRRERLDIDLVSITDETGEALRVETSNEGGWTRRFQIWVPGAQDVTKTVIIRYVVHNAIRFFGQDSEFGHHDELYWNVTGNEWEIPIEQATAMLTLPEGVVPTQSSGYTGPAGSSEQAVRIQASGNTVRFTATRALGPYEGFTVATGWPPGFVARPAPRSAAARTVEGGWPAALPVLAFFFAFGKWKRKGRDPAARAIAVQYEPPPGLSPAELGTLVDHKAEMHDITATLVDLAVRGFIHIEKKETKTLGIFSSKEYVFHLKKPREEWAGLSEHETAYLDAIFKHAGERTGFAAIRSIFGGANEPPADLQGAGAGPTHGSVALSQLKNEFYKDLAGIRKAVYAQLVGKGHYEREPQTVLGMWAGLAVAVAIGGIAGAIWVSNTGRLPVDPIVLGVAGGLSGLILLVFAFLMPARTVRGARAREAALGFREFLNRVEEDRFKRMITSPEMFERYLPFAMAFRVEKKWARAFEDMYTQPPQWYTGYDGGHFHASSFTNDINALSTAAASTMASSPSGSGGGGSSGGGSGGGGGGGF